MSSCLKTWAGLLFEASAEENSLSAARFNALSGFSSVAEFIFLPPTFQELVWDHRRSKCCSCSESLLRKKDLCVCLFCGSLICCNTVANTGGAEELPPNLCFSMHCCNCCGPPELGVALCIGDTNVYVLRLRQPAVLWGSLYVDKHGLSDPTVRRIQGLTLSTQRLDLLRSQLLQRLL
jgi:hypothetical protein